MKYSSICIFTHYGRTYTCRDVTMVTDNETVLVFSYIAMSDGKRKAVTFFKSNFIGFSVCGE
jgi:hypothetical protein